MKTLAKLALGVVMSLSVCGAASGQFQPGKPVATPPSPLPAQTPASQASPSSPRADQAAQAGGQADAPVRVVAQSVRGKVDYRPRRPAEAPSARNSGMSSATDRKAAGEKRREEGWVALKTGTQLPEGAEIQTGFDGEVVLRIGDTQEFTVRSLAHISVRQAVRRTEQATTRIGLEYGELRADVDSTRIANDVRVEAADVTLAVTGTTFFIRARPGFPTVAGGIKGNTGRFKATYANGQSTTITGDQQTDSKTPNPAERLSDATFVETSNDRAREPDEKSLAKRSVGGGDSAIVSLGVLPSTAAGSTEPPKDSQLKTTVGATPSQRR